MTSGAPGQPAFGRRDGFNNENFYWHTEARFVECERPDRSPDYISVSRYDGSVSSEYWYSQDGVVRGSDHWHWVATCDWEYWDRWGAYTDIYLSDEPIYGYCPWDGFSFDAELMSHVIEHVEPIRNDDGIVVDTVSEYYEITPDRVAALDGRGEPDCWIDGEICYLTSRSDADGRIIAAGRRGMEKQSRTPAEVIEDRQTIMEKCYGFWQGEKEYFTDYHDLYGDEYLDVSLGVCASPRELFESLYEVFTKDFFIDFIIWCYT